MSYNSKNGCKKCLLAKWILEKMVLKKYYSKTISQKSKNIFDHINRQVIISKYKKYDLDYDLD